MLDRRKMILNFLCHFLACNHVCVRAGFCHVMTNVTKQHNLRNGHTFQIFQGQNNPCITISFSLRSQQLFKSVCRAVAEQLQCVLSEGETCCPSQQ